MPDKFDVIFALLVPILTDALSRSSFFRSVQFVIGHSSCGSVPLEKLPAHISHSSVPQFPFTRTIALRQSTMAVWPHHLYLVSSFVRQENVLNFQALTHLCRWGQHFGPSEGGHLFIAFCELRRLHRSARSCCSLTSSGSSAATANHHRPELPRLGP
jgi:hypothetical protein